MENHIQPIEILLVEDNPNDVALILRALQKQNLANCIHVCEDGEEALDFIFHRGKFTREPEIHALKVIFLDLKLPKISGLEVLQELQIHVETKSIPVVVVSSSKEDPDIRRAYELGANSYVVKPVQFEDFLRVISEIGYYWLIINEPFHNR
jgi:two-component system response regulator